jgi:uncharacterized cupredoxin-like copper-binding protein
MRLVGVAYGAIVAVLVVYASQPFAADFIVVIAGFVGLFALIGIASAVWSGARTRPWFWLVATVPGVMVLLFNSFYGPYALAHPADALSFATTLVILVAGITLITASLTAWLEIRRGRRLWDSGGRAGLVVAGLLGLVIGACLTSVLAAASTSTGAAIGQPPAATATVTAQNTRFLETRLDATSGQVLGIFVTNKDGFAHSFDVDALGVHVPLPAGATTFVALKPTAAGTVQFYCAVPGHRDAGMVGDIVVK